MCYSNTNDINQRWYCTFTERIYFNTNYIFLYRGDETYGKCGSNLAKGSFDIGRGDELYGYGCKQTALSNIEYCDYVCKEVQHATDANV